MALSNLFGWKKKAETETSSVRNSMRSSRQAGRETSSMRNSMWSI